MFRWCAYCCRFIGESQPLDDFSFSHGICQDCLKNQAMTEDVSVGVKRVEYINRLIADTKAGKELSVDRVLADGERLGIRRLELLLGIVQPTLAQLGLEFQRHSVSVAEEHVFSEFAARIIARCLNETKEPSQANETDARIMLTLTPRNEHRLGLAMLKYQLQEAGYHTREVSKTNSWKTIFDELEQGRATLVGFSCGLETQVQETLTALANRFGSTGAAPFHVLMGGRGAQMMRETIELCGLTVDPLSLASRINLLQKLLSEPKKK